MVVFTIYSPPIDAHPYWPSLRSYGSSELTFLDNYRVLIEFRAFKISSIVLSSVGYLSNLSMFLLFSSADTHFPSISSEFINSCNIEILEVGVEVVALSSW